MYSLVDTGISECGALCFNKIVKSSVDVGLWGDETYTDMGFGGGSRF